MSRLDPDKMHGKSQAESRSKLMLCDTKGNLLDKEYRNAHRSTN